MDETDILKEELAELKENREIELLLTKKGVRNLTAAMAVFDKSKLERTEEGLFSDLQGAIERFKTENDWLFEKNVTFSTGLSHGTGGTRLSSEMTDEEYYTALRERRGR